MNKYRKESDLIAGSLAHRDRMSILETPVSNTFHDSLDTLQVKLLQEWAWTP